MMTFSLWLISLLLLTARKNNLKFNNHLLYYMYNNLLDCYNALIVDNFFENWKLLHRYR